MPLIASRASRSICGFAALALLARAAIVPASAATLDAFAVAHLDCDAGASAITSRWTDEGRLAIEARSTEQPWARVKDDGGRAYVLGEMIVLTYETYEPPGARGPYPACVFPVRLTYELSGLSRGTYRFLLIGPTAITAGGVVAALLAAAIALAFWRRRRSKRSRSDDASPDEPR